MAEREKEPLKGWEPFVPPHMVQIPLEEYRRYIESTFKGPTVEIPQEEYFTLRMDMENAQRRIVQLEYENGDLMNEINRRANIEQIIKQETGRILEMLENRNVTDSDTTGGRVEVNKYGKK